MTEAVRRIPISGVTPWASFLERGYALLLVLTATGLFRFVAPQLGISIGPVTMALFAANIGYLSVHFPSVQHLLTRRYPWLWMILLVGWPLAAGLYSTGLDAREAALQIYYGSLVLGAAVYTLVNGWRSVLRLLGISVAITLVGLVLSLVNPGYFLSVKGLISESGEFGFENRAFGFFMQPNAAAISAALLFVPWIGGRHLSSRARLLLAVTLMMTVVAITTSRGGILAASPAALVLIWGFERQRRERAGSGPVMGRALAIILGIVVIVPALLVGANWMLMSYLGSGGLHEKILFFRNWTTIRAVFEDPSVQTRLDAQLEYLSLIGDRPFAGYGLGSADDYRRGGVFDLSSHNVFVEKWFELGVGYVAFFLYLLARTLWHPMRRELESRMHGSFVPALVLLVVLAGMVSNTVLDDRTLHFVAGATVALLTSPGLVIGYEAGDSSPGESA